MDLEFSVSTSSCRIGCEKREKEFSKLETILPIVRDQEAKFTTEFMKLEQMLNM